MHVRLQSRAEMRYYRPDVHALQASSSGGHDKIVEMLLAKGANANARSRRYGTDCFFRKARKDCQDVSRRVSTRMLIG